MACMAIGSSISFCMLTLSHSFVILKYGIVNQYNNSRTPSYPSGLVFNMFDACLRLGLRFLYA